MLLFTLNYKRCSFAEIVLKTSGLTECKKFAWDIQCSAVLLDLYHSMMAVKMRRE